LIPVGSCGGKAWVSAARQFIVFTLDDMFCLRKGVVIACMVHVEMGADQKIDIIRVQPKIGKLLDHIFPLLGWWHPWRWLILRWQPTIDQNILPIARLHEIATR